MTHEIDELVAGVQSGDRRMLARAITLVESGRASDLESSIEILNRLHPTAPTSSSIRIGITGVPGVGKSTFLDTFGEHLIEQGLSVAVLAIDPTSTLSGGSILADKTRMERLSHNPRAFIRPTPGGLHAGGVARQTRETIALCEAAGFEAILVETIGIGQSEVSVSDMVDTVVLLLLAGAGDELQGIKRGIMELADVMVVHKADGDNEQPAQSAAAELANVINLLPRRFTGWQPSLGTCSSLTGDGIAEVYTRVREHRAAIGDEEILSCRSKQNLQGFEDTLRDIVVADFLRDPKVADRLEAIRAQVLGGLLHPTAAAAQLLAE
ncbi:MAG: methylmalonyl Co-A mutase-associated GTPase MeaB [Planctomycetota bacterium]|nr:methylmalonyl Co-A mutase-associated GTPase MeaB [Planctomycetota bacterium]